MPSVHFPINFFCSTLPPEEARYFTKFSRIQVCGPEVQSLSERPGFSLQRWNGDSSKKCPCHFLSGMRGILNEPLGMPSPEMHGV